MNKVLSESGRREKADQTFGILTGPTVGFAALLLIWQILALRISGFPGPGPTFDAAAELFSDPFQAGGPGDQGIGWYVLTSLISAVVGVLLAALVGIPAGFAFGRFALLDSICAPVIRILRPVSPLAWLPLGLLVFQAAQFATLWVIVICSVWPISVNTAHGVKGVPLDYLNVARVLRLSEWKVFRSILFPFVLPYLLSGIRLSVGTAWLVVIAVEMFAGESGLGFWLWDQWNKQHVAHVLIGIFVIGVTGFLLDACLLASARRYWHDEA